MENKSIVFLRSNPVSPDPRVEKQAACLSQAGYKIKILAWDRDEKYKNKPDVMNLSGEEVKILRFGIPATFGAGMKNLFPFLKFQRKLFCWLVRNKKDYDIIHACDFDTAFTGLVCAKILKKKLVFDIFDYLSTNPAGLLGKIIKRLENHIINNADGVIICTEQRKAQIADTRPKKLTVIHNSPEKMNIDIKSPKREIANDEKVYRIAYIGILQDYRLLKELGEAISNMQNVELHIGGFGKYENHFKELSEKHDNIKFYGKVTYDRTLEIEQNCDIMTAIYAPFIGNHQYAAPNKFYEALMLGKPLVMVKNTGMSDIVSENDIGVLIDYSQESFKSGIEWLMTQEYRWDSMSVKMKRIYEEQFSWDEMKKRLILFYEELA